MNGAKGDMGIVGVSRAVREVRSIIERVAVSDLPILITGETGVGKELVAQALHGISGRRGSIVAVNVSATSDGMFEDAMFGHVRGAFTGAASSHLGFFAEADRGTLFLDEVSSLTRESQAKLLRAVETRKFRPVGAPRDVASDCRIVAASNEELDRMVADGAFRADLAFRLRGVEIRVPPLRDRPEDVLPIAAHFLDSAADRNGTATDVRLSECARKLLEGHPWPGNVRELRQAVQSARALAPDARLLDAGHLRAVLRMSSAAPPLRPPSSHDLSHRLLLDSLERHGWDTRVVAAEFDCTRKTIYARMKRCGIPARRIHRRVVNSREFPGESRHGKTG
ncbi:MAG: sigma 54-interacting transcriptional regulator [Gemmatimonadales bacterium]|nr:sigma 54-interacting transcriptional regulator [Gemmatimonadales bacterium]